MLLHPSKFNKDKWTMYFERLVYDIIVINKEEYVWKFQFFKWS